MHASAAVMRFYIVSFALHILKEKSVSVGGGWGTKTAETRKRSQSLPLPYLLLCWPPPPDPSGLSPKAGADEGNATAQSSVPPCAGARLRLASPATPQHTLGLQGALSSSGSGSWRYKFLQSHVPHRGRVIHVLLRQQKNFLRPDLDKYYPNWVNLIGVWRHF